MIDPLTGEAAIAVEQPQVKCPECGGAMAHLVSDPGAYEGYAEEVCGPCHGTGSMGAYDAAAYVLETTRDTGRSVQVYQDGLKEVTLRYLGLFRELAELCRVAGVSIEELERQHPEEIPF